MFEVRGIQKVPANIKKMPEAEARNLNDTCHAPHEELRVVLEAFRLGNALPDCFAHAAAQEHGAEELEHHRQPNRLEVRQICLIGK